MDKSRIYLITSCKGGVGKSTVAVNLAFTMALCGERVLLADCDMKNRSLDLFLGYEDAGMFDLDDVIRNRVTPAEAILTDPRCNNLYYCSVPRSGRGMDANGAARAALMCADAVSADYLIIDTSGGLEFPLAVYTDTVYQAIIVTTGSPTAIRAAGLTGSELSHHGVKNLSLIINDYKNEKPNQIGMPGCEDINKLIDETRIPLLGVVLHDDELKRGQEHGKPAAAVERSGAPESFYNIYMRIRGENVPLFRGLRVKNRKKLCTPAETEYQ